MGCLWGLRQAPRELNPELNPEHAGHELEDAGAQLSKGDLDNYSSVTDHLEDAKIELTRYKEEGYMVDVPKNVVTEMSHGTISKLGLIIKQKLEGVKRRIILDLRRSGGNQKATLPERLVLPRPRDAIESIRSTANIVAPMD